MAQGRMTMPTPADDHLAGRLREAHAALDERPSVRIRAAVLHAAAQDAPVMAIAAAPAAAGSARARRRWSWRPPVTIGATALAGVLALAIGLRAERELAVPPAPARDDVPRVAAPAAPAIAAPAIPTPAIPTPAIPAAPAGPVATARPSRNQRPAGPGSAGAAAPVPAPIGAGAAEQRDSAVPRAPQAFPLAMPASSGNDAGTAAPPVRSVVPQATAPAPSPNTSTRSLQLRKSAAGAAAQDAAAARIATPGPGASPAPWMRYIVALRSAGRDAEADAELARFQLAYPGEAVPDAARHVGRADGAPGAP
jgi:hypothetical protein